MQLVQNDHKSSRLVERTRRVVHELMARTWYVGDQLGEIVEQEIKTACTVLTADLSKVMTIPSIYLVNLSLLVIMSAEEMIVTVLPVLIRLGNAHCSINQLRIEYFSIQQDFLSYAHRNSSDYLSSLAELCALSTIAQTTSNDHRFFSEFKRGLLNHWGSLKRINIQNFDITLQIQAGFNIVNDLDSSQEHSVDQVVESKHQLALDELLEPQIDWTIVYKTILIQSIIVGSSIGLYFLMCYLGLSHLSSAGATSGCALVLEIGCCFFSRRHSSRAVVDREATADEKNDEKDDEKSTQNFVEHKQLRDSFGNPINLLALSR